MRYGVFHPAIDARAVALNAVDTDGVKTAAATPVAAVTYSGVTLNGAAMTAAGLLATRPRAVSVTTTASVGTYNVADPIIVEGIEWRTGHAVTQALTLTDANGDETINGTVMFAADKPISIYVPAQVDAAGTFAFGVTVARAIEPPCHGVHISDVTGGTTVVARLSRQPVAIAPVTFDVGDVGDMPWEIAELHIGTNVTAMLALYGTPRGV